MDTVSMFACGIKRYLFTAIDVSTRFAFAFAYPSNSSINGSDFLTEKAHRGIGNIPPLRYYIDNFLSPSKKSNMLWTLTND